MELYFTTINRYFTTILNQIGFQKKDYDNPALVYYNGALLYDNQPVFYYNPTVEHPFEIN